MSKVSIIGAYNTKFGALVDVKDMISFKKKTDTQLVLRPHHRGRARRHRRLRARSEGHRRGVDRRVFAVAFVNQEHVAPIAVGIDPSLRFKPMTRTEAACASSSVAIYDADVCHRGRAASRTCSSSASRR